MTVTAIVVAAGSGARLGWAIPKAFVPLAGKPLVVHAVRALAPAVDEVVVVVGAGEHARASGLVGDQARVCVGGSTRRESVAAGLAACTDHDGVVAVHDAARPLLSTALVRKALAALEPPWSAVAPGLPVVDTLKLVDPARQAVIRTVDRRGLWAVQTPQVFLARVLASVHEQVADVTDDLTLVERAGGRVRVIQGELRNMKITFPEDLALAEALVVP